MLVFGGVTTYKSWDDPPRYQLPPPVHHPPGQIEHDLDLSQKMGRDAGPPTVEAPFLGGGWEIKNSDYYPYHPWDWYIYLHEWLIFMVNVGKYTIMDPMGYWKSEPSSHFCFESIKFFSVVRTVFLKSRSLVSDK